MCLTGITGSARKSGKNWKEASTGCDGKLDYAQSPVASHTLNGDYFWYEIGDMIGIGNRDVLYYCFPKNCGDVVAKTRLATEELYKMKKARKPRTAE